MAKGNPNKTDKIITRIEPEKKAEYKQALDKLGKKSMSDEHISLVDATINKANKVK
jgi:hypothetical protein